MLNSCIVGDYNYNHRDIAHNAKQILFVSDFFDNVSMALRK